MFLPKRHKCIVNFLSGVIFEKFEFAPGAHMQSESGIP